MSPIKSYRMGVCKGFIKITKNDNTVVFIYNLSKINL